MSIIGTYSPSCGTASESNAYDNVDSLLCALPDNDANLISARNVRDAVFTLWERIDTATASIIASASKYTSPGPSTIDVGGIPTGTVFNDTPFNDIWDMLLHPYVEPEISNFTMNKTVYEFGESPYVEFNYDIIKGSEDIDWFEIRNDNSDQILHQGPFTTDITGNHTDTDAYAQDTDTTYYLEVHDNNGTIITDINITWKNAIYWGRSNTNIIDMLPNGSLPTWAIGQELRNDFKRSFDNIDGQGEYLVFAWPTTFGTPSFIVNGNVNTAFSKFGPYPNVNIHGYSENYDIWISDTKQNSPITKFEII